MPFPFDKYPWLNFQELNLAYFIKHFREIFQQWDQLLNEMYDWKDATDAELAEWKSTVETGISSWETGLQQSMEDWKDETEADIITWEAATLSALDAWKTATTTVFEQIRTDAAASATAAAGSATAAQTALAGAQAAQAAAEAAAAGIQSELSQIQQNTADIDDLKESLNKIAIINLFDNTDDSYIPNAYIDGSGNIVNINNYFVSNHIPCIGGGKTYVCSYASPTGLTPIRYYRADGVRIGNITGTLSDNGKYLTFTIPVSANAAYFTVNGFITITEFMIIEGTEYPESYVPHTGLQKDVVLKNNDDFIELTNELDTANTTLDVINDALDIVESGSETITISAEVPNHFVNATLNRVDESSNYNISNSITLIKGQTLSFTAKGVSTVVGMICLYNENDDSYITVVPSIDSNVNDYRYTAPRKCVVRCSYSNSVVPVAVIITAETGSEVVSEIEDRIKTIEDYLDYPQLFDNIVFVGDSLTYGHDGNNRLTKNYPFYFGKLANCEVSNQGLSGRTAKQWWDELGVTFDFTGFDCAIIYLGTNQGLTDTVSTDCNASDYTQNADTNTGCYGKIIGKIQATNPNCKIFLIAGPEEYHSRTTAMNPAVRSLANFYNVGLLDMENCILSDDGSTTSPERLLYRPVDGIHYDTLGYFTFANIAYKLMQMAIAENLTNYKYA